MKETEYPVLKSLLDNDFYKFTMQNAIIKLYPYDIVRYIFINRGKHIFPNGFCDILKICIDNMKNLELKYEERIFLQKKFLYLDSSYLDFLEKYRFDPKEIFINQNNDNIELVIEGYWYRTILWEVPLMAIISELYYKLNSYKEISNTQVIDITKKKIFTYNILNVPIAEFGTRRRYSLNVHKIVLKNLKEKGKKFFIGSSNVYLSYLFNINIIGTYAHEWVMFHGAKYGFKNANLLALKNWILIYKNNFKIAISDTYTSNVFFYNFNQELSRLFDGLRHDSGDPISFTKKAINHYISFNINPLNKIIVFSDNLNPRKIQEITNFCRGKIKFYFGVGTNFTNDFGLIKTNFVIKMFKLLSKNGLWKDVIKISDIKNKCSGNPKIIKIAKKYFNIN